MMFKGHTTNYVAVKHNGLPSKFSESEILVAEVLQAIRVPGSTFSKLQVFSEALEGNAKELVSELMQKSTGTEIVGLLKDATKLKSTDIALIFTVLEKIILTIASELNVLESAAIEMAEILMTKHQRTFYYMLKTTNKSNQIKSALKLLIAVATLGQKTIKLILTHFDFVASGISALFSRRNTVDPQDVRACVVHFFVALLMFGDNVAVRQFMQAKNLLTGVFSGLIVDRSRTIELFLSTLLDRIVKNMAVPKTLKVQIFNQTTLKQLLRVLQWNGHKKSEKGFSEELVASEVLPAERESVCAAVMQILNLVCASGKYGIVFHDPLFGTGPKNCNHILTDLLRTLSFSSPHQRELATTILLAAPDQLMHFLPTWKPGFIPRSSEKWSAMMVWLTDIYSRLDVASKIGKVPTKSRIKPVLALTFPPVLDKELQQEAFGDHQPISVSVRLMSCINDMLITAHGTLSLLNPQERNEFISELGNLIIEPRIVLECLTRTPSVPYTRDDLLVFFSYFTIQSVFFPGEFALPITELTVSHHDVSEICSAAKTSIMDQFERTDLQAKSASSEAIEAHFNPSRIEFIRHKILQRKTADALRTSTSLLLLQLSQIDGCRIPLPVTNILMESYSASLSAADQNIFSIIRVMDSFDNAGICFSVFGNFAKRQTEFRSKREPYKPGQPTLREFVDSLDPVTLKRTVFNFPIRVPLLGNIEFIDGTVFDPRYLLVNFTALISGPQFNASHFVESGCLSIVFAALGSLDVAMRAAAAYFLRLFEEEVTKLKFKGREQLIYILAQIRRSHRPEKAWPNLWTTVLNRFLEVMFDSANHIYQFLMEYFLVKPDFRLDSVPEFLKLFESGGLSHVKERRFILELIRDGLRHYQDYELCERSHAFEMIFAMTGSMLSNKMLNLLISEVVLSASRVPFVGRRLVKNFSIFSWISYQLENIDDPETLSNLVQCSRNCFKDVSAAKKKSSCRFSVNLLFTGLLKSTKQLELTAATESALMHILEIMRFSNLHHSTKQLYTWDETKEVSDLVLKHLRDIRPKTEASVWRDKCTGVAHILGELENLKKSTVENVSDHLLFSLILVVTGNDYIDID